MRLSRHAGVWIAGALALLAFVAGPVAHSQSPTCHEFNRTNCGPAGSSTSSGGSFGSVLQQALPQMVQQMQQDQQRAQQRRQAEAATAAAAAQAAAAREAQRRNQEALDQRLRQIQANQAMDLAQRRLANLDAAAAGIEETLPPEPTPQDTAAQQTADACSPPPPACVTADQRAEAYVQRQSMRQGVAGAHLGAYCGNQAAIAAQRTCLAAYRDAGRMSCLAKIEAQIADLEDIQKEARAGFSSTASTASPDVDAQCGELP